MKAYARTAARQLFSEDTQRKALAKSLRTARTKGKTAIRGYARIAQKQGVAPSHDVAKQLREQYNSKTGMASGGGASASSGGGGGGTTSQVIRRVTNEEIEQLSTLIANAWNALAQPFVNTSAAASSSSSSPLPASSSIISAAASQRQTRLKQFFYGSVFLLRQGLVIDDIEVFQPLAWLDELPDLNSLMQHADTSIKHKLLTDGRNAIVAALRNHQVQDMTLRSVIQHIYPERYVFSS